MDCRGLATAALREMQIGHTSLAAENSFSRQERYVIPASAFSSIDPQKRRSLISRLDTSFRSDQCLAKLAAFRFDIGRV
jgi:hypothetical protein